MPQEIGFGVPGKVLPHPKDFVQVTEIVPGDMIEIDGMKVTNCENTHYRGEEDFGKEGYLSLSLRFDLPERSVVVTGDTGPCNALQELAMGADIMIGEMMDSAATMVRIRAMNPQMPEERLQMIGSHMAEHHLGPEEIAELAQTCGIKKVVSVHFPPGFPNPAAIPAYLERIKAKYDARSTREYSPGD